MDVSVRYLGEDNSGKKIEMEVTFKEMVNGLGYNAQVNIWVPNSDSRSELEIAAKQEAYTFLQRTISDRFA